MKYVYAFILIIALCLSSCQKEIDVLFPFEGSRFFVFGVLKSDELIQVLVDKTYTPNGKILFSDSFLDSTEVSLYEDGVFIENLTQSLTNKHLFQSEKNKTKTGRSYQIKVKNPHIPEAISNLESLLTPVTIDSAWLDSKKVISPLNPSNPTKLMHVAISGISTAVPIVFFELKGLSKKEKVGINIFSTEKYDELENPCLPNAAGLFYKTSCYKEDQVIFSFYVEMQGVIQTPPYNFVDVDNFEIKVSSVNNSFLKYYKNDNSELDFFSILEGIKPTYSTIINGYGAVLTKNTVVVNLKNN